MKYLSFLLIFISCQEKRLDSFDIDTFEGEKLVLKMFMGADNTPMAELRKTVPPFSPISTTDTVEGASIQVLENGLVVATLDKVDQYNFKNSSNFRFESGKTYSIAAQMGDITLNSDLEQIPSVVPIIQDSFFISPDSNSITIHFHFTDNAATTDFYRINTSYKRNGVWENEIHELLDGLDDPCVFFLAGASSDFILPDLCINGQTLAITRNIQLKYFERHQNNIAIYGYTDSVRIILKHISPAYYDYLKSASTQYFATVDPFSDVFNVYSNIIGGYGIAAGFAADTITVDLW